MTTKGYYAHARSLGAFAAENCLRLARQAVSLDEAAEQTKAADVGPSLVCYETLSDSDPVQLSFSIKVF